MYECNSVSTPIEENFDNSVLKRETSEKVKTLRKDVED